MSPLSSTFPAALMRLFEEELLVRVDAVVHETRELVFYFVELVVGDRLRDGGEATAACRARQPGVRQPCCGALESHALCLCCECWGCFLRLARRQVSEWMQRHLRSVRTAHLVQRAVISLPLLQGEQLWLWPPLIERIRLWPRRGFPMLLAKFETSSRGSAPARAKMDVLREGR